MYFIESESYDPYYNLALEEYLLNMELENGIFLLWQNQDTVVIGRYQNTFEEIDLELANLRKIHVVRRNSGGGAVFHDLGNLNYSIIRSIENYETINLEDFVQPIINVLSDIGVKARFSGRNDIEVDKKKIGGIAQYISNKYVLIHGTLLINSNKHFISEVLTRNTKIEDRESVKSVRREVVNLTDIVKDKVSVCDVKQRIKDELSVKYEYKKLCLSDSDKEKISKMACDKYKSWEWNFGKTGQFNYSNVGHFAGGMVKLNMMADKGIIKSISFTGDFFCNKDINSLEQAFVGKRISDNMFHILQKNGASDYIQGVSERELAGLFRNNVEDNRKL